MSNEIKIDYLPLGTTEAAVRSCVSVIAAVTAQREEILAYWLDLYYQVRRAYEVEQEREEDPRLIRREDLYPVMREMMRDALKSTARNRRRPGPRSKPRRRRRPAGKPHLNGRSRTSSKRPARRA